MRRKDLSKAPPLVLTVGHSNRRLEDFLSLLQEHNATLLVDVRRFPRSRSNPQFNGDRLPMAIGNIGIAYVHLPGLGGRRRRRPDSPNLGWNNASFQGYADYMQSPEFEAALQELIEIARGQRAVLLCAEALPWRCHRSLIADALVVRGMAVKHILGPSRNQTHELREWAHVDGTLVTYPAR